MIAIFPQERNMKQKFCGDKDTALSLTAGSAAERLPRTGPALGILNGPLHWQVQQHREEAHLLGLQGHEALPLHRRAGQQPCADAHACGKALQRVSTQNGRKLLEQKWTATSHFQKNPAGGSIRRGPLPVSHSKKSFSRGGGGKNTAKQCCVAGTHQRSAEYTTKRGERCVPPRTCGAAGPPPPPPWTGPPVPRTPPQRPPGARGGGAGRGCRAAGCVEPEQDRRRSAGGRRVQRDPSFNLNDPSFQALRWAAFLLAGPGDDVRAQR